MGTPKLMSLMGLLVGLLLSAPAWGQFSLGFDVGFTMPTDQYHKPEPYQSYGLFIDPRPGFYGTLVAQMDWRPISAYAQVGWMNYRTYDGIGPFLHPTGIGIEPPTYGQATLWRGPFIELGLRKTVYRHSWANLEIGIGGSYSIDYYRLDSEYPETNQGFVEIAGSVYFEQELTFLTAHSFMVSPHIRFWRKNKHGHRMWLKAQYSYGLNKKAEGAYDIYNVDTDNNQTYAFSFDVVLRHSFYNITFGYALFPNRTQCN